VLKISDFGLSTMQQPESSLPNLRTVCGTPNYLAPEMVSGAGYNGFAVDCWSCGVVLYEMLAGYSPFESSIPDIQLDKLERGEYRMASHFGDSAKDLIRKLLTLDPAQRLTVDGAMQHPWLKMGCHATIPVSTHK